MHIKQGEMAPCLLHLDMEFSNMGATMPLLIDASLPLILIKCFSCTQVANGAQTPNVSSSTPTCGVASFTGAVPRVFGPFVFEALPCSS
jgi:hypothetical protein